MHSLHTARLTDAIEREFIYRSLDNGFPNKPFMADGFKAIGSYISKLAYFINDVRVAMSVVPDTKAARYA